MKPQSPLPSQFFVVIAVLVLSGCMRSAPEEEPEIRYGLGLEIPSPLPPRGPFLEGEDVVQEFRVKLEEMVPKVLQSCGANFTTGQIREAMDSDLLYAGVYGVYRSCLGDASAEAARIAHEAKLNGTEEETYAAYLARAQSSLERQVALLDGAPQGATVAEVEMVGKLQAEILNSVIGLDTVQGWMDHYLNVSRDEYDLSNVFLNLMLHKNEATIKSILDTYAWTTSTCRIPDEVQLEQRVKDKLYHAIELARKWDTPEKTPFASNAYDALTKSFEPMISYASDHDWWQVLLRLEMELDHIIGEYETYETNVLPTPEEARYLVALYWNQSRNLVIQDRLDSLAHQMDSALGQEWYEDDLRPRMALSLEKMHWTYAQVECD